MRKIRDGGQFFLVLIIVLTYFPAIGYLFMPITNWPISIAVFIYVAVITTLFIAEISKVIDKQLKEHYAKKIKEEELQRREN